MGLILYIFKLRFSVTFEIIEFLFIQSSQNSVYHKMWKSISCMIFAGSSWWCKNHMCRYQNYSEILNYTMHPHFWNLAHSLLGNVTDKKIGFFESFERYEVLNSTHPSILCTISYNMRTHRLAMEVHIMFYTMFPSSSHACPLCVPDVPHDCYLCVHDASL